MARIPEQEIERPKNEVSVERLVGTAGIELKKSGKDWLGRCPFWSFRTSDSMSGETLRIVSLARSGPRDMHDCPNWSSRSKRAWPTTGPGATPPRQRKGSARTSSSSSPASFGSRGLPGWMIATWQLSAASTSWR